MVVIDDRNDWYHVPIFQLQIGQRVLVQNGQFSFVFASTHNDSNNVIPRHFVQLQTRQGFKLTLSASHYVPIVMNRLKPAGDVLIGDTVMLWNGSTDEVIRSQRVWKTGLHNPQTLEGTIVVDGVVASTFTSAVEPITATALLTPIRSLFFLGYSGLSQM